MGHGAQGPSDREVGRRGAHFIGPEPLHLERKTANLALRRNAPANANGLANEIVNMSSSLRKILANATMRQNLLAKLMIHKSLKDANAFLKES